MAIPNLTASTAYSDAEKQRGDLSYKAILGIGQMMSNAMLQIGKSYDDENEKKNDPTRKLNKFKVEEHEKNLNSVQKIKQEYINNKIKNYVESFNLKNGTQFGVGDNDNLILKNEASPEPQPVQSEKPLTRGQVPQDSSAPPAPNEELLTARGPSPQDSTVPNTSSVQKPDWKFGDEIPYNEMSARVPGQNTVPKEQPARAPGAALEQPEISPVPDVSSQEPPPVVTPSPEKLDPTSEGNAPVERPTEEKAKPFSDINPENMMGFKTTLQEKIAALRKETEEELKDANFSVEAGRGLLGSQADMHLLRKRIFATYGPTAGYPLPDFSVNEFLDPKSLAVSSAKVDFEQWEKVEGPKLLEELKRRYESSDVQTERPKEEYGTSEDFVNWSLEKNGIKGEFQGNDPRSGVTSTRMMMLFNRVDNPHMDNWLKTRFPKEENKVVPQTAKEKALMSWKLFLAKERKKNKDEAERYAERAQLKKQDERERRAFADLQKGQPLIDRAERQLTVHKENKMYGTDEYRLQKNKLALLKRKYGTQLLAKDIINYAWEEGLDVQKAMKIATQVKTINDGAQSVEAWKEFKAKHPDEYLIVAKTQAVTGKALITNADSDYEEYADNYAKIMGVDVKPIERDSINNKAFTLLNWPDSDIRDFIHNPETPAGMLIKWKIDGDPNDYHFTVSQLRNFMNKADKSDSEKAAKSNSEEEQ